MRKDFRISESMETMETMGASAVTTEDLLTIILGNREKAAKLLHQEETLFTGVKDGLSCIASEDYDGLRYLGNLTQAEASRLLCAIELGKRIAHAPSKESTHITSPFDAASYLMKNLRYETHEKFYVMMLNTKNRVIRIKQISEGSLTSSVVHPREVLSSIITAHSASFIIFHNHPSGRESGDSGNSGDIVPSPSTEDRNLTKSLSDASDIIGVPMLDHVIISGSNYFSFKEHGLL